MSNVACHSVKRGLTGLLMCLALSGTIIEAHAQVGHPPESSPYTRLRAKRVISLGAGYMAGSPGSAGVGPANGPLVAARFNLSLTRPLDLDVNLGVANLDRGIIDPSTAPTDSIVDTAKQTVTLLDAGLVLKLTGQKTWHRTIPYLGLSLGVALGGNVQADSLSGFSFKTQFQLSPGLGVRWYPSDRLMIRVDFRDVIWRLSYPPSFFTLPEDDPLAPPVLNPNVRDDSEWTHHPTLTLTLGYAIGF
ncbi:MAG: hypothetical protein JSW71_15565 [Gemmatimonadota bacterium]|nr:MAG: hypothetical protein JSW71_15565 [Gemmatimonadota bacterium]